MGDMLSSLLMGVPYTLALTALVQITGMIVGAFICALRVSGSPVLQNAMAMLILTFRGIPPLVWLFVIFFGVGTGFLKMSPFVAAWIGLGLITAVNMAEIYRGALAAVHRGQWEASTALGLPRASVLREIIAPQLLRLSVPAIATYAIGLLKDTAVASIIGVPELAFQGYHYSQQTFRGLEVYAVVAALYIAMSLPIAWFSRRLDTAMRARVA